MTDTTMTTPAVTPAATDVVLRKDASRVASVFNGIAIGTVIIGVIAVLGFFFAGVDAQGSYYTEDMAGFYYGLAVSMIVYTIVGWASAKLASVAARYIASRS